MLATNPDYTVLRESAFLFLECFGGYPKDIVALHEIQRLETLMDNVDDLAEECSLALRQEDAGIDTEPCDSHAGVPVGIDSFEDLMQSCTGNTLPSDLTARSRLGLRA